MFRYHTAYGRRPDKDIARELNVSVVTVSKALRNHEDIGTETRSKVPRLMEEMSCRPNLAARALVTGRSFIVASCCRELERHEIEQLPARRWMRSA
jgi:DNA-binding LacI/PurR family transcriptional regulator